MENTTKIANRYGLNLKFYEYNEKGTLGDAELALIDFANEVSLDLTSEITWATGGQAHSNMIGFRDPIEGTLKISTQAVTNQLLNLITGGDVSQTSNKVSFKNTKDTISPKPYIIVGETVWKDETGKTYAETITVFKACVKPGYSVTYTGTGDPQSLDVEFELGTNADGNVVDIERADETV